MTVSDTQRPAVRLRPDATERLEALLAAPGPHLEPVLDVGRATNGDLLLVLPDPAARLAALGDVPGWPTAGEAVTVLVPLADALARLHAAGVAHGGVGPHAVALDADGAPYWLGPEAPVLRRRVGEAAFAAAVEEDVRAFRALCGTLLGRAGLGLPAAADLGGLADAVFGLAAAAPVRLHPAARLEAPVLTPSRLLPAVAAPPQEARTPGRRERLTASLRAVRLRVWVAAGAVAVLLAVVPVLLPSGRSASAPVPTPRAPTRAAPVPTVARALEPAEALRALLDARARCLATGAERCLDGVDAAGSPVHAADLAAIASGAEPVRLDARRLRVRTAGGGLALADAAGTTVLAVREPDGWRLRDLVPPPG